MFGGSKPWDLSGRVAVVTGAGGAIGREVAIILRRDYGCHLALCDNDETRLSTTLACVTFFDPHSSLVTLRTTTHVLDVANRAAVFALADDVRAAHGRCEIVFNNAGVASSLSFDQSDLLETDKVLAINMGGVLNVAKAFLPLLKEGERSALVNTSSILGLTSFPMSSSYCISKYAVTALSQCLALECAMFHPQVLVCCVHPGFTPSSIITNSKQHILPIEGQRKLDISETEKWFRAIGSTEPAVVASAMVEGMRRGKQRIVVGTDAKIMDFVVRMFPGIVYKRKTYLAFVGLTLVSVKLIGKKVMAALLLTLYYFQHARINARLAKIGSFLTG